MGIQNEQKNTWTSGSSQFTTLMENIKWKCEDSRDVDGKTSGNNYILTDFVELFEFTEQITCA